MLLKFVFLERFADFRAGKKVIADNLPHVVGKPVPCSWYYARSHWNSDTKHTPCPERSEEHANCNSIREITDKGPDKRRGCIF
jgi:hypothetical protein